jgi:conjugative transfer region protein TrbK
MMPSITAGTAARVGAMAFVVLAIATTAVHFKPGNQKSAAPSPLSAPDVHDDALRAELTRCQLLGEAGAQDDHCLRAWAENRRRFLRLPVPPTLPPAQMVSKPSNGSPNGAPADRPNSKGE